MASSSADSSDCSSSSALQSSSIFHLKLCYLQKSKLFSLPPSAPLLTFSKLLSMAASLPFPDLANAASVTSLELSYLDAEGDTVLIDGDESLRLALLSSQNFLLPVIKIYVNVIKTTGPSYATSNPNSLPWRAQTATVCANRPSSTNAHPCTVVCWHFNAGRCKFGTSCRFLHQAQAPLFSRPAFGRATPNKLHLVNAKPTPVPDGSDIDSWLVIQKNASEHENISYLSSPEGHDSIMRILNHLNLPQKSISTIVNILTRPKFRTSLLKQATDKIYNALLGSQFLHALHSHIRSMVKPTVECIGPYVILCEELMGRTSHGWKEVPLDELKALVDEIPNDSARELNHIIARMLDHRAKQKRMEAVDERHTDDSPGPYHFRNLPIVPSKEQLLSQEDQSPLPVNQVGLRYQSLGLYLETHFRLMQEDCISTLRDGIHELRKNSRDPNLHVYTNVCLAGIACGNEAIVYRVSFHASARHVNWQVAKRLMYGSLLCMSDDNFQTFLWAVVSNRTTELLSKNLIDIRLLEDSNQKSLDASCVYMMAESAAAYFEAYSHVLQNLQRTEMEKVPFQEHLISLEPHVKKPVYLKERNRMDVYDFGCAFPLLEQELLTTQFHILQDWPKWKTSLDASQMRALKHGLTKRLALIQGPPGTGKTFIGLLIVKIILRNLKQATPSLSLRFRRNIESPVNDTVGGPILIICYTNHALDQFLEGLYAHEKNIVRVGGRSKSPQLENRNLQVLLREGRRTGSLNETNSQAYNKKKGIEEEILKCADLLNINTASGSSLHGIATEEQIQSLFYEGCNHEIVVKMWLSEKEREPQMENNVKRQSSRDQAMHNPYKALMREEEGPNELRENSLNGGICLKEASKNCSGRPSKFGFESLLSDDARLHDKHSLAHTIRHEEYRGHDFDLDDGNVFTEREGKDKMKMIAPRDTDINEEEEPVDSSWTKVMKRNKAQRGSTTESIPNSNGCMGTNGKAWSLEMLRNHTDVWSLDGQARRILHRYWIDTIRHEAQDRMNVLSTQYEEACTEKLEIENEIQLSILRTAKVVGMTTTAAARHHSILESLQAEIIVIEEAAEVLESHILACLTATTKHLILIGDHLQLRPAVAVHKLAVKHQLDVSLFERLVKSGIEYVTLEVQRRMRPHISKLISSIYPMLKDHESVSNRENIRGMKSNVFFLTHSAQEEHGGDDELGKVNVEEAQLVVNLCHYLLKQGYTNTEITILSMYRGQTMEILQRLKQKVQCQDEQLPRISSVDDYQGEECDIILLSLVRSNSIPTPSGPGKVGFLAVSNRVCVSLSRARNGLFIFGNGELLSRKSELWGCVIEELKKSDSYGDALILLCQNHPKIETKVQKPNDFQAAPDGGCDKPCEHQLDCGHACPRRCHPGGHDKIVCPKRCPRKHPVCNHQCQSLCHGFEECPPCREPVVMQLPRCGHSARVQCSTPIESVICDAPCPKVLACSHKCFNTCGRACRTVCKQRVERILPCGHSAKIACYLDPLTYVCTQPCKQNLPECQHPCWGTCGTCKQGTEHIPCRQKCNRALPCGHPCMSFCHEVCPPCFMPCLKSCQHSHCPKKCGYLCVPCMEPCEWTCRHHTCKLLCHELCERPQCDEPCEEMLACGHPCVGLCGEPCPPICRICTPQFKDIISQMVMEEFDVCDRFIQLQDCGHVFEVSGLDAWMKTEQSESGVNSISPKQCPECRRPIMKSLRYNNHVKRKLQQIEDVKQRILEFEVTNEGIRLLQEGDYGGAVDRFVTAIERNEANLEAYIGLGTALCLQSEFKLGVQLFKFVVKRSCLAYAVDEVESPQQAMRAGDFTYFFRKKLEKVREIITKTVHSKIVLQSKEDHQLAKRALVQWATALSNVGQFAEAIKACEIVLKDEPGNKEADETLRRAKDHKTVVAVMLKEVGKRGHWYRCPNGHYYVVGECGGPMQVSVCPDCKAIVGGQNHAPAAGNTHASIDGSTHSAWSDRAGLANYLNLGL